MQQQSLPVRNLLLFMGFIFPLHGISAQEPFESFLEKHCNRCHGPEKVKGELRIDKLSRDFKSSADSHRWAEVIERVNAGDMPPKKEPRPTQDEIAAFVTKLDALVREGRVARMSKRPAVAHYRLSRGEYQNTVYDLLGVRYDPSKPGELNADPLWHGYDRIGSEPLIDQENDPRPPSMLLRRAPRGNDRLKSSPVRGRDGNADTDTHPVVSHAATPAGIPNRTRPFRSIH